MTFLEEFLVPRLVPDASRLRWMSSDAVVPKFRNVPSANKKMKFPLFRSVHTSFPLSLLAWSSVRLSLLILQCLRP